jgi:D-tyrosyl-tRNA(Tyr) deacylase
VHSSTVSVDGEVIGSIGRGLLVYLGIAQDDEEKDLDYLVRKVSGVRVFGDADGRPNLSVTETGGEVLVISQFTLYGDTRKGRRPSYNRAAGPEGGEYWYGRFVDSLRDSGVKVATGRFRAHMDVASVNDGPITILIDSRREF